MALVATVRSRLGRPRDELGDPLSLTAWLVRHDLPPAAEPDPADVREFQALREAAYRLLADVTEGRAPAGADVELVNQCAAHTPPAVSLAVEEDGGVRRAQAHPTPAQALGLVARDLVDLVGGPLRGRLHQCEAEVCGTFFVDTSRAGRRRWCSSATCGNRARVAAHRDRAARP
ncbi:CGNR zinc finger domain-containing protein [Saccharothrix variisporea]|uniref:CGNR zinc finger domain-containing protein n=1 Tax=Saccharothrix variisporea TaxID=543527 RepID=UPI002482B38D|nr:ABATE domain-containing protein [Saccharothrix variisporea]